jgi:hypothetical protein
MSAISVRGRLVVQRKTGRKGDFNVGDLSTEIGQFEVKDQLIEEYEPGTYTGHFLISWIEPDSYSWKGRVFVKVRATVEEIIIDDVDETPPQAADSQPPEPDPAEPPPAPAAAPGTSQASTRTQPRIAKAKSTPAPSIEDEVPGDAELFGAELFELLQKREPIKLDPTVDRVLFRAQRDRLKACDYDFNAKAQTWFIKDAQS